MSYFLSFAVILSSLCNWKGAQSYKKLPEAIVPKVGHGPKMGQYGFDCAWFFVVFLFLLCFIAHLYEANGGTDMEVLACFRPGFFYYFHVNGSIGIVQKIGFEIRPDLGCTTLKTSRKVVLENPSVCLSVCVSVCPSVLLSLFPRALTGLRFNRSSWNFRDMFGYMGHCAVPIFEAIREPVYKII